jgi:phosphoglycerol transferase
MTFIQRPWTACVATFLVALGVAVPACHYWNHCFTDPHCYAGDGTIVLCWVKGVLDNPWALENQYLGAPFKQEMYDFPISGNVHFLALKALGQIKRDPFWVVNVYYLLSYPLAAVGFWALARSLGIHPWIALVFGVLFAFLPGHFWRGTAHLFLSTYFLLPLAFIPVVWLSRGELKPSLRDPHWRWTLLIAAACGSDGAYFALFTGAVVALGCLIAALQSTLKADGLRPSVRTPFAVASLFIASFAFNLAPVFLYHHFEGRNPSPDHVSVHDWSDGEHYGLKLTSLVMPSASHPVRSLREIRREYYEKTPLRSEADAMALGLVGSFGMFAALFGLLRPNLVSERGRLFYLFGISIVVLALVTTISGFATLANLFHFRSLRSYNRSSFYIAILGLAAAALLADIIYRRYESIRWKRIAILAGVAFLLPCGLMDQAWHKKAPIVLERLEFAAKKRHDEEFFQRLEAGVPAGSMVFQLPYIGAYSQTEGRHRMYHYDHYRAYLHTRTLRWSYGAMHGRATDRQHQFIAGQPTATMCELLAGLEFEGIYVDRLGYADGGQAIEAELKPLLGAPAVVSANGRMAYYSLASLKPTLKDSLPGLRAAADGFPSIAWSKHVGREVRMDGRAARFVCGKFQATVTNPRSEPQRFTFAFTMKADAPMFSVLSVQHGSASKDFDLFAPLNDCRMEIALPPGTSVIEFAVKGAEKFGHAPGGHLHLMDARLELQGPETAGLASRPSAR